MKRIAAKVLSIVLLAAMVASCTTDEIENDRDILIINDQGLLQLRVTEKDEPVDIVSDGSTTARTANDFTLTLKSEVSPPEVDGNTLQATSVTRRGNFYAVSYNFRGEVYAGAIDLFNDSLILKSQILFNDADISDLDFDGNRLYFAGATSSLENPAFVEVVRFNSNTVNFNLDGNIRRSVGSFVANSVLVNGGRVYVTSGNQATNGGGLYSLNRSLEQQDYIEIQDARWVTSHRDSVYVLGGNPANVFTYGKSNLQALDTFPHAAVSDAEGKATMDVTNRHIFVAGGDEGLLVYDHSGELLSQYEFEGLSTTNAVTADGGKLFISNGEAGVFAARYTNDGVVILGRLEMGDHESVNHILLRSGHLYVATGLGGLKVIQINN